MLLENEPKKPGIVQPAGMHTAWLYGLIDVGTQKVVYHDNTKYERHLLAMFELCDEKLDDGRPMSISKEYNRVFFSKSSLFKDISAWLGVAPGDKFNTDILFDTPCNVTVTHRIKEEKTYANVTGIAPLKKNEVAPPRHNNVVEFSLDNFKQDVFDALPGWVQNKIKLSPEYAELTREPAPEIGYSPPILAPVNDPLNDEIPF